MTRQALNLLGHAVSQPRAVLVQSSVCQDTAATPLPTTFSDPLYVEVPWQTQLNWTFDDWPADHGTVLPAAGSLVVVAQVGNPIQRWVERWAGATSWTVSPSGWVTPTISSPWTAGSPAPEYLKDAFGFVHLRGSVSAGAAESNVAILTLPAGFRPGVSDYYPALTTSGAAGSYAYVSTAGVVQGSVPAAGQLWLNAISFLAEN